MEPALLDVKAHLAGQSAKGWRKVDTPPPLRGWRADGKAGEWQGKQVT